MNEQLEIDYYPHPYQEELHLDNNRFICVVGGRRVGKSQVALQQLIVHCLTTPHALAWWIAPTYKDAREIGWEMLLQYIPTLSPAIKTLHNTNLSIKFINGATLLFKGADNENGLRGRGLTYCVIDEAAFIKEDVWTKALRPALSDKKGKALFTSTPNGRNWYYDLYRRAVFPSTQNWNGYHWTTSLNPLIDEQELEDARSNLSDIDYRQEYLAEFVTRAGMIYDDFNQSNIFNDTNSPPISPFTHQFYLGIDFGYANPTAACLMAVDNKTEYVYQIDELYVSRTPIERISSLLLQLLNKHKLLQADIKWIYSDPAGNADEISSGISPVDYLRNQNWRVDNKGSQIAPGLALVRSYILNAAGVRRYFVHERCVETIRSINGYTYKLGIFNRALEEPDKDGVHDHMCDAVRYFFVNRFDHAKYFFSDLNQHDPYVENTKKSRIMKRCGQCKGIFISNTPKHQPPFLCNNCQQELINEQRSNI